MHRTLIFVVLATVAPAARGADDLAAQVARARAEVDELAADLEAERAASREELAALVRRKSELEGELDLVRRTSAELTAARAALEAARAAGETDSLRTRAAVLEAAARLRRHINAGLPLHLNDRSARVAVIEEALARGAMAEAVAALERLTTDELALTTSSERLRHPIQLDGAAVLAEVVRVGMAYLVFRDAAGNAGVIARGADGAVVTQRIDDATHRARVLTLIDAMRRGTASGPFLLPLPNLKVQP